MTGATHPGLIRRVLELGLVIVACLAIAGAVRLQFEARSSSTNFHVIAEDALTYLAAGERLNAGHELYTIGPGDRPVGGYPEEFAAPLLSPPPIAVVWRPLALFGESAVAVWMVAAGAAVLAAAAFAMWREPVLGSLLVLVSALGIGEQLLVGNLAAFFAPAVLVLWAFRDRPWVGAIAGTMAAFKLAPIVLAAWLIGTRRWAALGWMAAAIAGWGIVSLVGAGPGAFLEYVDVARATSPSPASLSGLTGIPWMSYAALVAFGVLALVSGRRDGGSHATAVTAFSLFTPAFYLAAMVTIPPLAIPLTRNRDA